MAQGDHITVKRMKGVYKHHGIDMGDGTVIHFSGEPLQQIRAIVCQIPLEEFLKGGEKVVVQYTADIHVVSCEETLTLARELLGKSDYNLFHNNCEHFATYCKTGQKYSMQVKKFVKMGVSVAGTGLVAIMSIAAAALLADKNRQRRV